MKVIQLTVLATVLVCSQSASAVSFSETWVSHTGNNTAGCGAITTPCLTIGEAIIHTAPGGQINVLDAGDFGAVGIQQSVTIVNATSGTATNISGGVSAGGSPITSVLIVAGPTDVITLRGFVLNGDNLGGWAGVVINNASRVNIEDCLIVNNPVGGIVVLPSTDGLGGTLAASFNVKIKNSTITGNGAGIKIAPTTATPINVVIEGTAIDNNNGGGLRVDGTSGGNIAVSASDSSMSMNAANGVVAISGSSNVMINLTHDIIASNGQNGIEAIGGNAAVLVDNTSILNNTTAALSAVSSGRLLTYQNNRVVGTLGTGFTQTTGPQ